MCGSVLRRILSNFIGQRPLAEASPPEHGELSLQHEPRLGEEGRHQHPGFARKGWNETEEQDSRGGGKLPTYGKLTEIVIKRDEQPVFGNRRAQDLQVRCSRHAFDHGQDIMTALPKEPNAWGGEVLVRNEAH